jgi:hypothetical protein
MVNDCPLGNGVLVTQFLDGLANVMLSMRRQYGFYFQGMKNAGYTTLTYEIEDSTSSLLQDMLVDSGFLLLLRYAMRVRRCGIALLAPVCSSWCWMNRHTSGRDRVNALGNPRVTSVAKGNLMVTRVILILELLICRGCVFIVEQPLGSILDAHPRFVEFVRRHVVWRVFRYQKTETCRLRLSSWSRSGYSAWILNYVLATLCVSESGPWFDCVRASDLMMGSMSESDLDHVYTTSLCFDIVGPRLNVYIPDLSLLQMCRFVGLAFCEFVSEHQ